MPYLTLDDQPVSQGSVSLPLTGRAVADLRLASTSPPPARGARVALTFAGGLTYRCTVERAAPEGGFHAVRLVGGTGGLSTDVAEQFYADTPKKQILTDLLTECGETPGDVDLPGRVPFWVRPAGPAHEALRALLAVTPERTWRVQPDGRVWVGVDTWPDADAPLDVEREEAARGVFVCRSSPGLTPGQKVTLRRGAEEQVKRATRVTHVIGPELRTEVMTGDGTDLGPAGIERTVRQIMRHTDYHALRPATLLRDHGDHTVDVQPQVAGWPALSRIPLHVGLPSVAVKLKSGSPMLLFFEEGNPAQPRAECRAGAALEYLQVRTGKGQTLTLDDDRGQQSPENAEYTQPFARLEDQAGQVVELWAEEGKEHVTVRDKAGQTIVLDPVALTVTVIGTTTVQVTAAQIVLNGGVQGVARVGDSVEVDPITHLGTITSGSTTVKSG